MKIKKIIAILGVLLLCVSLLSYFMIYKLKNKEKVWLYNNKIIEEIQIPNINGAPDFFPIKIISMPTKDDLKDINKELIIPKAEVDKDFINKFLESNHSNEDYTIKFTEDGAFEYKNRSIKQEVVKLSQSDAIKLGKKLLDEMNLLHEDAIVYDIIATNNLHYTNNYRASKLYDEDEIHKIEESNYILGYYCMYLRRSYNNIPIFGDSGIEVIFNTNGIHSLNYNWNEIKITNKDNFISYDIMLDNFLKGVIKTVDFNIYIKSCFSQVRENEDYCLCYAVIGIEPDRPPYYIDTATGKYKYYHFYGTIYDGVNKF